MDYNNKYRKLMSLMVIMFTITICSIFYISYEPNAYEIKMNDTYCFYVQDKDEFVKILKDMEDNIQKEFKGFEFKDKFTWNESNIESKDLTPKEEIQRVILESNKKNLQQLKSKEEGKKTDVKVNASAKVKADTKTTNNKNTKTNKSINSNVNTDNTKSKATLGKGWTLISPCEGTVSSSFGMRWGKMHKGLDIANVSGSPIYAALEGTVTYSGWMDGYGNVIKIDHGSGIETLYAHCKLIRVKSGEKVSQGQLIGDMGSTGRSTGPHVHFEVIVNGVPENPAKYI